MDAARGGRERRPRFPRASTRIHYIGLSLGGMIGQEFRPSESAYLDLALPNALTPIPPRPPSSAGLWEQRKATVRMQGTGAALADGTMQRWFTDEFQNANPQRWDRGPFDTICAAHHAARLRLGCALVRSRTSTLSGPARQPSRRRPQSICGGQDQTTPPERNKLIASKIPGRPLRGHRQGATCRMSSGRSSSTRIVRATGGPLNR